MKPRIMIVDDEESIRKLLNSRLEREGYPVTVCSGAAEAEAEFKKGGRVGVLITDLKMPGKDGFQLTEWARKEDPLVKVIVITGHGEKDAAIRALKLGASDYLEKPFDMDELSHSVRRCVGEYQLANENQDLVGRLEARIERVEGKQADDFGMSPRQILWRRSMNG